MNQTMMRKIENDDKEEKLGVLWMELGIIVDAEDFQGEFMNFKIIKQPSNKMYQFKSTSQHMENNSKLTKPCCNSISQRTSMR